jgi:hypothetical protein
MNILVTGANGYVSGDYDMFARALGTLGTLFSE